MTNFNRDTDGSFQKDSSIVSLFHGTKAVLLEDELNELQWTQAERLASIMREQYMSGFSSKFTVNATSYDNIFTIDNIVAGKPLALLVDGYQLKIGNNTATSQPSGLVSNDNRVIVQLPAADTTTRTDLVILEAWFEVIKGTEQLRKFGGVDTPILTNTIIDPRMPQGETSRRIQLRWRIRTLKNQSAITNVTALDYKGTDSGVKYTAFDEIYSVDLGTKLESTSDIKSFGKVYGIPLFKVARTPNNNTITSANITNLYPKGSLRILEGYDISQITHAQNYVKSIKVESKGLSSTIGDKGVTIDGKKVFTPGRSYGLVVLERSTGNVVFSQTYDVYDSTVVNGVTRGITNATAMANQIATYDKNYIVIVCTYDEPMANRDVLLTQIKRCGGTEALFKTTQWYYRGAYILVGIPGIGEGKGMEKYEGIISSDPAAYASLMFIIADGEIVGGSMETKSGGGGGTAIDKKFSLASMSNIESQAEILRGMGASGMYAARQYGMENPFDGNSKVYTVSFATIGEHNHPNYRGMPGTPELAFILNGYYLRTRHNDYRMFKPVANGSYLSRVEVMPPAVPTNVAAMSYDQQKAYMQNVHTANPQDCQWNLAYVEAWWENLSPELTDYADSFRHALNTEDIYKLFSDANFWSISGLKNISENVAFFPVVVMDFDANGNPKYLIMRYRINTQVVSTLKDTPFNRQKAIDGTIDSTNRFTLVRDLQAMKRFGYGSDWSKLIDSGRARFKCADLDKFMRMCPGIEGEAYNGHVGGESVVESVNRNGMNYTVYEKDNSAVLKAGYYNHDFLVRVADAAGRNTGERDYNDPNLYVAKTSSWENVVHLGYSYAMPLELVLRTPRESWNPYNLPEASTTTLYAERNAGKGMAVDKPYSGWYYNDFNFTIPADLYGTINDPTKDPADTYNSAYITCPDGVVRKFMGTGIKIFDYDNQRMRFPVYPEWHEATKGFVEGQYIRDTVKNILLKMFKGTATETDIKNMF
jgi:hypothetical protein